MFRTNGAVLLVCLFLPAGCIQQNHLAAPSPLTQNEAVALIMNLPESKAWAAAIEKAGGGEAHAAFLPEGDRRTPPLEFWKILRVEDHADHVVLNQIFFVSRTTREVFVYDDLAPEGQELIPLAQWHQPWPK
jgi:hypothetical protein